MRAARLSIAICAVTLTLLFTCQTLWAQQAAPEASGNEQGAAVQPESSPVMASGDDAYELKLKQLEEKVNQLKEKIFRSKTRLLLLQETILHGVIAGSKSVITHKNDIGSVYKLESVAYYLDGAPIFGKIDIDGDLNNDKEIEIYNGTIQPGNHLLSVYMVYRGHSAVFVYVEGIQVKLKSSYTFKAEEGKITKIDVVGYDKGGSTARFEERPAVKYQTHFYDLQEENLEDKQDDKGSDVEG